jgi:hypothetical protein
MTAHRPGFPRQSHGPEAHGATAPIPPAAPVKPAHGAKASRTDARRPQSEGQKK